MASAQFTNKEDVLQAYDTNGISVWAIFANKVPFIKGEGYQALEKALDLLEEKTTNCLYTLKVYEDINPKSIREKTEASAGFNFYLNAESQMITTGQYQRMYAPNNELISVVNGLKKELEAMKAERDEEPPPSKLGIVGEIMDHPVIGSILEKIAMKFIDQAIPAGTNIAEVLPMRAVGNISTDQDLVKALEKLKQYDPNLTKHLQKLADIAEKEPATFAMVISALDKT